MESEILADLIPYRWLCPERNRPFFYDAKTTAIFDDQDNSTMAELSIFMRSADLVRFRPMTSMARNKAILSEPDGTPRNSTNNNPRPRQQVRERLPCSVLEELWSIWQADPRVPSVKSRRSWAISRNANPRLVDSWFLRRKTFAKKAGQPIPDESYDLPLDPPIVSQREPSRTPFPDLPSDDTLVYPADIDDLNNVEASSDTIFDDDAPVELKGTATPAYMEVLQQPQHEHHHSNSEPEQRFDSTLFPYAIDFLLVLASLIFMAQMVTMTRASRLKILSPSATKARECSLTLRVYCVQQSLRKVIQVFPGIYAPL